MVSKDQSIGGIIFLVCAVVAVLYVVTLFYPKWIVDLRWASDAGAVQFWIIAVPVFIAFVAIMGIGAWIGWTMATTPPPKPIEEITTEIEEKTTVVEEEAKPAEEPKEEKKPEKKKKTEV
ncbi:transcriptional regulator [Candidatus Bathyarchaeota archaeon]|jgi:predicted DNA-binding transcriptional regulator|nr:transcriptional regulator [Candidatus Bathyarchaeota archaeon]